MKLAFNHLLSSAGILIYALGVAEGSSGSCYSSLSGANFKNTWKYQTSDYCKSLCSGASYIALKGGNECYCINDTPSGSQTDSSDCNKSCMGYGIDTCGGDNAYNVYKVNEDGSLTPASFSSSPSSGGSSLASASSSSSPSSLSLSSFLSLSSLSLSSLSRPSQTSSLQSQSSSDSKTTSASTSQTVSTKQVTLSSSLDGSVKYITTTASSSSSSPTSSSSSSKKHSKSTNVGAIVGGVVGGAAGGAVLGLLAFFFVKRRNHDDSDDEEEYLDKPAGMLRGSSSKSKTKAQSPLDMPVTNPFTDPTEGNNNNKTNSGLVDPRLNPIMMGRRRLSEGSLADEADYSRKILQVTNPDD